jgi:hypothetical protein
MYGIAACVALLYFLKYGGFKTRVGYINYTDMVNDN